MKEKLTITNFGLILAATAVLVFLTIVFGGLENLTQAPKLTWPTTAHRVTSLLSGAGVFISLLDCLDPLPSILFHSEYTGRWPPGLSAADHLRGNQFRGEQCCQYRLIFWAIHYRSYPDNRLSRVCLLPKFHGFSDPVQL